MSRTLPSALMLWSLLVLSGCAVVQLEQLQGQVTYRERIALPPGSEVRVALEEVDAAGAVQRLVAEQVLQPSGQVPVAFALSYDPAAITKDGDYRLVGEIRNPADQLLWRSRKEPLNPFAPGAVRPVELVLKRAGGADKPLPTWHYRCDDVDFTFVPGSDDNAGLYFDNRHYQVKRVPSASGARYEGEGVMFWSKGRDGVLNVGGKTFAGCNGEPQ